MIKLFFNFLLFFSFVGTLSRAAVLIPQSSLEESKYDLHQKNEISAMEYLMENTTQQLEIQKQLKQLMLDFQTQKEVFIQGKQTKTHAALMVRTARQIYETIQTHHLQYLFS